MIRWEADTVLVELIRRYYAGEAGLWLTIRDAIDAELHRRGVSVGAYHIRLRCHAAGYTIQIDDAAAYANDG